MTANERRKFLKASLASLAGAAGVSLPGCEMPGACCYKPAPPQDETLPPEPAKEETSPQESEPTDTAAEKAAHREELKEQLKELGETDPGEEFDPISADCYDISWDYEE